MICNQCKEDKPRHFFRKEMSQGREFRRKTCEACRNFKARERMLKLRSKKGWKPLADEMRAMEYCRMTHEMVYKPLSMNGA